MSYKKVKRALDVAFSSVALMVTLPLTAAVSAYLFRENNGDIFFKQKRMGMNGKEFNIVKFKTMSDDCDPQTGELLPDPQRVSKIGRLMRKWGIDEIPQFFNIIKGDMSLIGPRPINEPTQKQLDQYDFLKYRQSVRPGLIAPVYMFKSYKPGDNRAKMKIDMHYVRLMSAKTDAVILCRAVNIISNHSKQLEEAAKKGANFFSKRETLQSVQNYFESHIANRSNFGFNPAQHRPE